MKAYIYACTVFQFKKINKNLHYRLPDQLYNCSSGQQAIQMEQDVDLDLLREREQALHQLEVIFKINLWTV